MAKQIGGSDGLRQLKDELKQKIKDFYEEWRWQIEALGAGTMLMTLGKMVEKLKEANILSGGFLKNMNTISKIGLSAVVITLQWTLMDQFLENFIQEGSWAEFIKAAVTAALGTWALGAMWGPTGVIIALACSVRLLDGAARRGVVASNGESECRTIIESGLRLHQALAVGAATNDCTSVVILQCAGQNLARRCTRLVNQNCDFEVS